MTKVVLAIIEKDGKFLMGKRNDSQKWTAPAGHVDENETEVKEETDLEVVSAELIAIHCEEKVTGYVYKVKAIGNPDCSKDVDKECSVLEYKDIWEIRKELNVPWSKNWLAKYWGCV
jgi:ADP-ribose pyrophosphatase YjhB (NUDIX family)